MKKDLDYYLNLPYKIELKNPQSEGGDGARLYLNLTARHFSTATARAKMKP
nr:hypothetical protein [uncultured Campylobacter sp.]